MQFIDLELVNFQAHKRLTLDLRSPITSLQGATDVGKSAVLRALRWCCLNDIAGDEFIREGAKETSVTLRVQVDKRVHTIRRTRGRENTYELDGKEYKAFGTSVPADIAALLQLNEINFQAQHDGPFWFNESAPEVSRRLNAVIDLSVIDTVLSNIASEVRLAQERKAVTEERLQEAKAEWELDKPQLARVEEFEDLLACHNVLARHKEAAERLLSMGNRARDLREHSREREEQWTEGKEVQAAARAALDLSAQCSDLRALVIDAENFQVESKPPPSFDGVEQLHKDWREQDENVESLARLVRRIGEAQLAAEARAVRFKAEEKNFHKQIQGKTCPLCQQTIQSP